MTTDALGLRHQLVTALAELDHKIGEQKDIITRANAELEQLTHLHTTVETALQGLRKPSQALAPFRATLER